jgi:hypothetical protein
MPLPSPGPAFGDADLPFLIGDTGIPVTVGGVDGIGILTYQDEVLVNDPNTSESFRGQVVVLVTTLTVQTSAFPLAKIGDAVVIDSQTFSVRERLRDSHGGITKLLIGV